MFFGLHSRDELPEFGNPPYFIWIDQEWSDVVSQIFQGNTIAKFQQNLFHLGYVPYPPFIRKVVKIWLYKFVEMDDIVHIPPLRSLPIQERVDFLRQKYGHRANPYHPVHVEAVEDFQIRPILVILCNGIDLYQDFFIFEIRKSEFFENFRKLDMAMVSSLEDVSDFGLVSLFL